MRQGLRRFAEVGGPADRFWDPQDLQRGLKSGKSYLKSDYKISVMTCLKGLPIVADTGSLTVYKVELLNQGRENITLL